MTCPAARRRPLWILLLFALGCGGGPSGPSGGSLRVTVQGLPGGSAAAVNVSGPGGFSQSVTATQTFTQLTPGAYTVAATSVTVGPSQYSPNPTSQTVTVNSAQANASVFYSTTTGNLTVTINGLGSGSTAAVTVTGPGSYTHAVPATTTLTGLTPGDYTVTARDTAATGGTTHTAAPTTQTVTVAAQATASATVTYSPPPANGSVNLHIAGMYLTQSAQNYAGSVPAVKNRNGYLRVFVVADRSNTAKPSVRVRFYNGGVSPIDSVLIPASPSTTSTPTAVDESSLSYSWNTPVSGTLIQPGLRIEAEVNPPPRLVVETDTTDNKLSPPVSTVQTVPRVDVTFVPVIQRGNGLQGRVTTVSKDSFLLTTKKMHPIDTVASVLHAAYTTTTTQTLQADNSNSAWATVLGEIDALRVAEHSPRHYYGVVRVAYTNGVAGVAYVSNSTTGARAALGWDYLPSGSVVAAHELGHNWGRSHAPCGGPTGLDPNYPHPDGSTGSYGVDVSTQTLEPATTADIMGYCDPKWISDYTYQGVLNYLLNPSPPILSSVASQDVQPCLLVWGHIINGELVLEPAFQLATRPSLPVSPGPYSLEARADDGSTLFALSFTPNEIADAREDQQNFVFAVPLSGAQAARLSSIRVAGRGREAVMSSAGATPTPGAQPQGAVRSDVVQVRRVAGGRVSLRWDSRAHPMVMVRDPETGQVLSFARGGDTQLSTLKGQVDLLFSNGVTSQLKRVSVAR